MTFIDKLRLMFVVMRGDAGPEDDHAVQSAIEQLRDIERRQIEARERLEAAMRLSWLTAQRDNISRRPEGVEDEHAVD